jgi:uncharacterized surface anchored protein
VVASSDQDRSLGTGGDPSGADLTLSLPGDAAGAYFAYDSLTGEITAEPVSSLVTLTTDLGEQLAMGPRRQGGYRVTWDAQPGTYGFQILVNGQPVTQDNISLDAPRRVIVEVDDTGAVTTKDTLRGTTLDVSAVDVSGAPRTGSCFAIIDRDGSLEAQACDADDSLPDGIVRLRVPDGLDDGTYTLRETLTAAGAQGASDQDLQLGPGQFLATATSAGAAAGQEAGQAATEEPTTEQPVVSQPVVEPGQQPGQLIVLPVDDAGNLLPGACFTVLEFGFAACDDDGDGTVVFDAVPPSPLTLRETAPPPGFSPVADLPINIEPTGAQIRIPHQPEGGAAPTEVSQIQPAETPQEQPSETPEVQPVETPQVAAGAGQVVLSLRDQDGNPVSGACWRLSPQGEKRGDERCDADDGADDGQIVFDAVSAGRYRLEEVTTPSSYQPADGQGVDVSGDAPTNITVEYRLAQGRAGRLVIVVTDENGNPVPQTCFDLIGPVSLTDVCDGQDDGRLNVPDIPAGRYTVTQTATADGRELAPETTVVVPEDDTVELPITNQAAGTNLEQGEGQTVTPAAGAELIITVRDQAGTPVADACATLDQAGSSVSICDQTERDRNDQAGQIDITDLSPGVYTLSVIPPEGFEAAPPAPLELTAGQPESVEIVLFPATPRQGDLQITAEDAAGNRLPGACYTVEIPSGGQSFGPFCDDDGDGVVDVTGVTPGQLTVVEATPPTDTPAADPDRQDAVITAGQQAQITFLHGPATQEQPATGSIEAHIAAADGTPVAACVDVTGNNQADLHVCDDQQGDASDQPGQVKIDNLPPGTYTVDLSNLARGATAPESQSVDVAAGKTSRIDFATGSGPGTLVLLVQDEAGQPLGGSCFTLQSDATTLTDVCDQGDDGRLNIPDLPAGTYTLIQTRAADGHQVTPGQEVTIAPGQSSEVTLVNPAEAMATPSPTLSPSPAPSETPVPEGTVTPAPEATAEQPQPGDTGTVEFVTVDDAGNPVTDQCYTLTGDAGSFGPFCDNGEGDTSTEPGVLSVEGLPVGNYEAVLDTGEATPGAEVEQQARQRRSVSVRKGRPTRTEVRVRGQQNQRGDLVIRVRDQDGNDLAGACFGLIPEGDNRPSVEVCDNRAKDNNSSVGRILISDVKAGRYTLTETQVPAGYAAAPDQPVRIASGGVREVSVTNQIQQDQTTSLTVQTVDQDGNALPSACYAAMKGAQSTEACDADTGDDGTTQFSGLEPGSYVIRQIQPPSDEFATANATAMILEAGQSATVTVVNERQPGSLLVRKTDGGGQLLSNACFDLLTGDQTAYSICDNDASDGDRRVGILLLGTVTARDYVLRETQPPVGYLVAQDQQVTITPNQRAQTDVVDAPAPAPQRRGDVRVLKIGTSGQPLAGSCFTLVDGNGASVAPHCDADDGADDGVVQMRGVAIGKYTLRETRRPSADYETAADVAVEVTQGQTTDVQVANRLRAGGILIRTFDPTGVPLPDACFDLQEDSAGAFCTDENGQLLFTALPPGTYTVVQTEAPAGYLATSSTTPVQVRPGRTATVDVVNQPAPPPPDSGSIQVRKFFCPVTEGQAGIIFVDSSDPNGGALARTAGCSIGDAGFTLDGPSGRVDFRTGDQGRYQATVPTGDYVLTENSTGASEDLTVFVNTLTTIVVVNYVEPEGEEPATIDVLKYTCEAGFQGSLWADFAAGCVSSVNLTNNVTFRLSGVVSAQRVTGDTGAGGTTTFDGLTAGDYQLREETPAGTVAVYAFCGLDPANPSGRAVGNSVGLRLAAGQTVTCHWFNVPEDLTSNTGALTVYKFACPVTTPPANFDWYARCDPQGQGVNFNLSMWDGARFVPVTTAATDNDGILRFTRLQPGTYDLKEVKAVWCHAESDNVDAQGHVIVAAGKRASVWIFNCVGAKRPPNTGAGPLWSNPALPAASAAGVAFGLLWPIAGLATLRRRRFT